MGKYKKGSNGHSSTVKYKSLKYFKFIECDQEEIQEDRQKDTEPEDG